MSDTKNETQPLKKASRRGAGFLLIVVMIGLGLLGGYRSGLNVRQHAEATLVAQQLDEQFALAQDDVEAGRYDVARQRLEYIIQNDPEFPGALDLLTQVDVLSRVTPTVTPTMTPTLTPTPDLSGAESIYARVQDLMAQEDWEGAVNALDELRKTAPDFRTADVDGLYYMALRNAGVQKIIQDGELENGMYYLTQAERFGPLDGYAEGLREGARLYVTGSSFWELDWGQALYYFDQVYRTWPNLWDSASGYTATDRFRIASVHYADILANQGKWCQAEGYYDNAQAIYNDAQVVPTAQYVYRKCHPPTHTPLPVTDTPTPTATPTPTP